MGMHHALLYNHSTTTAAHIHHLHNPDHIDAGTAVQPQQQHTATACAHGALTHHEKSSCQHGVAAHIGGSGSKPSASEDRLHTTLREPVPGWTSVQCQAPTMRVLNSKQQLVPTMLPSHAAITCTTRTGRDRHHPHAPWTAQSAAGSRGAGAWFAALAP